MKRNRPETWTWANELAATILYLRDLERGGTMARSDARVCGDLAEALVAGEHLHVSGELSAETSSPRRKRSAK